MQWWTTHLDQSGPSLRYEYCGIRVNSSRSWISHTYGLWNYCD